MLNDKFPEKLISALGTATLAAVFALWCAGSSYGAAGYACALCPSGARSGEKKAKIASARPTVRSARAFLRLL